jgi:hypothetical protein
MEGKGRGRKGLGRERNGMVLARGKIGKEEVGVDEREGDRICAGRPKAEWEMDGGDEDGIGLGY